MPESHEARRLPFTRATLLIPAVAFAVAAGSMIFHYANDGDGNEPAALSDSGDVSAPDEPTGREREQRPDAETLAEVPAVPGDEPELIEVLRAADLLVQAGAIEPPPPEPTMLEILQSAEALVQAGLIEPPAQPTLLEILQSADALVRAGVIAPPQPSLMEVLLAADELRKAGALPGQAIADVPPPPPPAAPIEQPALANEPPPPPPPPPAPAAPPPSASGWFDAEFEARVMASVNARRAAAGLGALTFESRLTLASQRYAQVLADNNWFSHTGPDGSSLVDRVTATGFPFDVVIGEIIAWGTDVWPAGDVVQAWIDSAPHREQIMEGEYRRAGVGCYFTVDGAGLQSVRCVMDFAG